MEGPREGQHNNLLIGWQGKFKMEKPLYHIRLIESKNLQFLLRPP